MNWLIKIYCGDVSGQGSLKRNDLIKYMISNANIKNHSFYYFINKLNIYEMVWIPYIAISCATLKLQVYHR